MPSSIKLFSLETITPNPPAKSLQKKDWIAKYSVKSSSPADTQLYLRRFRPLETSVEALSSTGEMMNVLRKENRLVDVNIICGSTDLPAHRLVLASSSPFFKDLLIYDSLHQASSTLDLEDVDADFMELLLEFMYTGQAKILSLDIQKILCLITTAHLLQITAAAPYFCEAILQSRPNHHLIALWNWAEEYKNIETEELIMNYVLQNFNTVIKLQDFGDLSLERLTSILSQPVLALPTYHDAVMQSILIWIKHKLNERRDKLHLLLPFVYVDNLSENLLKYLGQEPLCKELPNFNNFVERLNQAFELRSNEGTSDLHLKRKQKHFKQLKNSVKPVPSISKQKCVTFILGENQLENKEQLPDTSKILVSVPKCKQPEDNMSSRHTLNEENGTIVLVAGRDDANRFVWQCYLPSQELWSTAREINVPIKDKEGFAYYKGEVFLIGGENSPTSKLRDLYIYNLTSHELRQGSPLWVGRASPTIIQSDNLIFTIGGMSRFEKLMTHVECLNANSGIWRILPPIKEKRSNPGTAVLNGNIYLIGGHTTRCEYYNTSNDTWISSSSLPNHFQDAEVVSFTKKNKIYALRSYCPDKISCYDPLIGIWQMMKTNGHSPEYILSVAMGNENAWCLDKNCKLFYLEMNSLTWKQHLPLPRGLNKPRHIAVIKLEEADAFLRTQ